MRYMLIGTLLVLALVSGCANQQPQTSEQINADIKLQETLLKGALTPGKDKRCIHVLSFQLCYSRERSVYMPRAEP